MFAKLQDPATQPQFWDRVADDVDWTVEGTHPLAGHYHDKAQFIEATFARLAGQAVPGGVKLEVTPRVTTDGFVTVKMHPEVSTIKTPPGPNIPPTIATREADSSLTVRDGTPIILAGLIQKNEINTTVKVPLLGDIPILGWLFRSVSTDNTNNEVIFVITPHILQKGGS